MTRPPFPRGSYALRVVSLSPERRVTSAQILGVWAVLRPHPTRQMAVRVPPEYVARVPLTEWRAVPQPWLQRACEPFCAALGLLLAGVFWLFLGGLGG